MASSCRACAIPVTRHSGQSYPDGLDGGTQRWYTRLNPVWRKPLICKRPKRTGSSPASSAAFCWPTSAESSRPRSLGPPIQASGLGSGRFGSEGWHRGQRDSCSRRRAMEAGNVGQRWGERGGSLGGVQRGPGPSAGGRQALSACGSFDDRAGGDVGRAVGSTGDRVAPEANEITAALTLLKTLPIEGAIIS